MARGVSTFRQRDVTAALKAAFAAGAASARVEVEGGKISVVASKEGAEVSASDGGGEPGQEANDFGVVG